VSKRKKIRNRGYGMPGDTDRSRAAYQHSLARRKMPTLIFLSAWLPNPNAQS